MSIRSLEIMYYTLKKKKNNNNNSYRQLHNLHSEQYENLPDNYKFS